MNTMPGRQLIRIARKSLLVAGALLYLTGIASADSMPGACSDALLRKIPPRPSAALAGDQFERRILALNGADREADIEAELLAGNLPQFLRKVAPVDMRGQLPDGEPVDIIVCVLSDYLAVGTDTDFFLVPMRLATALDVANRYDFTLPTSKMVDAIYEQAHVHLAPQPLPAGDQMRSTAYYWHHNELIADQRAALGFPPGELTAGHKKDLVITNRLWRFPDRVAIYGWHRGVHSPIQPLSTVHGARYADYSHGVRLVSTVIFVNGKPMSIFQALTDAGLSGILSGEGPLLRVNDLISKLAALKLDLPPIYSAADLAPSSDAFGNAARTAR